MGNKKRISFQKVIDEAVWINFRHRTTDYRVGVIENRIVHPKDKTFKGEHFEKLPEDYSTMTYNDIASIGMDEDPLKHWEEIRGMISVMDGELLRFILAKKVPIDKLIRYELTARGYDKDHKWCGFEKAKEIWLK